jgi:hypothetical protein
MREKRNFLQEALNEIRQLYGEIEDAELFALRTSLPKALRIGELLLHCPFHTGLYFRP